MSHCPYQSLSIRSYYQLHTDPLGHNESIQELKYGHILIICHGRQEETFSYNKETREPHLCSTTMKEMPFFLHKDITEHLGRNGRGGRNIYKGEVAQEKVCRRVKSGINPNVIIPMLLPNVTR